MFFYQTVKCGQLCPCALFDPFLNCGEAWLPAQSMPRKVFHVKKKT